MAIQVRVNQVGTPYKFCTVGVKFPFFFIGKDGQGLGLKGFGRSALSGVLMGLCSLSILMAQSPDGTAESPGKTQPEGQQVWSGSLSGDSALVDSPTLDSTKLTGPKTAKGPLEDKVHYTARDSMRFELDQKMVRLWGDAVVQYQNLELKAGYIELYQEDMTLYATSFPDSNGVPQGRPVFREGGTEYESEWIRYNFRTRKGRIHQVITQEGEGYLHGTEVKYMRNPEGTDIMYGFKNKYTTCDLEHPHYYIAIRKSKITKNQIISGPAWLVVEDIPLPLVVPFGFFPNTSGRSSGILIPEIGESSEYGFFLRGLGFYWGLSDYADLTFRSDLYTKGSRNFDAGLRYARRYRYNGNWSVRYGLLRSGEPELPSTFSEQRDFNVRWVHSQDAKARPGVSFSADVNAGSSSYLKRFSYNPNEYLNNTLRSSISLGKTWRGTPFSLSSSLGHSQNLNTGKLDLTLPSARFNMSTIRPFQRKTVIGKQKWYERVGVSYGLDAQNRLNTYDTLFRPDRIMQDLETGFLHSPHVNMGFTIARHFQLNPSFSYREGWYLKETQKTWDAANKQVITERVPGFSRFSDYGAGASLNTQLFGMMNVNRWGIKAVRHVFRPSISYNWRPDFSQDQFGYYRSVQVDTTGRSQRYSRFEGGIYGGPGAGRVSSIGVNLNNNFEMKVRSRKDTAQKDTKVKLLESLNASSSWNFAADSMNMSPIGISARTNLFNRISVQGSAGLDPYQLSPEGLRINQFVWEKQRSVGRLTSAQVSLGGSLNGGEGLKPLAPVTGADSLQTLAWWLHATDYYVHYDLPWNINWSYSWFYSKPGLHEPQVTQTLGAGGDVKVTPKWRVGANTGYNLETGEITNTNFNIYRDLHCWEMKVSWTPFGFRQFYSVDIKVKANMLSDLKLTKKSRNFF